MFKSNSGTSGINGLCGSVVHPFIVMHGVKFQHLKHIIDFMYQGEIRVLDSDLEGVLSLGESLQVKGLCSVKLRPKCTSQSSETNTNIPNSTKGPTKPKTPNIRNVSIATPEKSVLKTADDNKILHLKPRLETDNIRSQNKPELNDNTLTSAVKAKALTLTVDQNIPNPNATDVTKIPQPKLYDTGSELGSWKMYKLSQEGNNSLEKDFQHKTNREDLLKKRPNANRSILIEQKEDDNALSSVKLTEPPTKKIKNSSPLLEIAEPQMDTVVCILFYIYYIRFLSSYLASLHQYEKFRKSF